MTANQLGRRSPRVEGFASPDLALAKAAEKASRGAWFETFDHIAEAVRLFPAHQVPLLARAWDLYAKLRAQHGDRWNLYQGRFFDPKIRPDEKVLDLGSGHHPFPFATNLSDISVTDGSIGRNGARFENPSGLPVHEFPAESIPFGDREFDFLYCSHVLEHSPDPAKACSEIVRVARRGYIETPTAHKDLWMGSAQISNHTMAVDWTGEEILFRPYSTIELDGLGTSILMDMHCSPTTDREKALAASIWLFADRVNTMVYWERNFRYRVSSSTRREALVSPADALDPIEVEPRPLFLQVHPFYPGFLQDFHARNPHLQSRSHGEMIAQLLQEGFSDIHMFAPHMRRYGYDGLLIVPNDPISQARWWMDFVSPELPSGPGWSDTILRAQIDKLRPAVLYLVDAITWDSKFVRTLRNRPPVVCSWRAADIPPHVDWTEIDLFISGLSGVRELALRLGARRVEAFHPGFDPSILARLEQAGRTTDIVFCGSISPNQHATRIVALEKLADAAGSSEGGFSLDLHLNAEGAVLPESIELHRSSALFGIGMYRRLAAAKMTVDIRGNIRSGRIEDPVLHRDTDLARDETMNMRIFEATGCGTFLLTEHYGNLSDYFEIGREIETFRDLEEMIDKVRFYLRHDALRERIARNGQERCLREHNIHLRTGFFASLLASIPGFQAPSAWKPANGFPTWNLP